MSRIHEGQLYRELRCRFCRNLIGWEYIHRGMFMFECPRCLRITTFEFKSIKDIRKGVNKQKNG